jgi:hypothetical protein
MLNFCKVDVHCKYEILCEHSDDSLGQLIVLDVYNLFKLSSTCSTHDLHIYLEGRDDLESPLGSVVMRKLELQVFVDHEDQVHLSLRRPHLHLSDTQKLSINRLRRERLLFIRRSDTVNLMDV